MSVDITVRYLILRSLVKIRTDVLARLELGVLLARQHLEGVGTEVVTLGWHVNKPNIN